VHILLVEDDDRVAAALRPALRRHGIATTRLAGGRGAVDHLADIDVVLLDLSLPDIDGIDVCRAIRAVSDVPVIVVSARGEVDDRILGLHSGAETTWSSDTTSGSWWRGCTPRCAAAAR
jgi:DNA-binding response OmpR family regulator